MNVHLTKLSKQLKEIADKDSNISLFTLIEDPEGIGIVASCSPLNLSKMLAAFITETEPEQAKKKALSILAGVYAGLAVSKTEIDTELKEALNKVNSILN
jgi:hypothetical protein